MEPSWILDLRDHVFEFILDARPYVDELEQIAERSGLDVATVSGGGRTPERVDGRRVFLSYTRADAPRVERLETDLHGHGIPTWRDIRDVHPGDRWRTELRRAIRDGGAFVLCCSAQLQRRNLSTVYEELNLAAQESGYRRPDRPYLIPVRLDECAVPSVGLPGGGLLDDEVHHVDLFEHWESGVRCLAVTLRAVLGDDGGDDGGGQTA